MPLQKQMTTIPFVGGLDTKTDPKQVQSPKLLDAQNVVFTHPGRVETRNGFKELNQGPLQIDLNSGQAIMTYQNELLASDGQRAYSYLPAIDAFSQSLALPSLYSASVTQTQVNRDGYQQLYADMAVAPNGLQYYVWEDSETTDAVSAAYKVLDSNSGTVINYKQIYVNNGFKPKVIMVGDYACMVALTNGSSGTRGISVLMQNTVDIHREAVYSLLFSGQELSQSWPVYDLCSIDGIGYIAFFDNSGNIQINSFGPQFLAGTSILGQNATITPNEGDPFLCLLADTTTRGPTLFYSTNNSGTQSTYLYSLTRFNIVGLGAPSNLQAAQAGGGTLATGAYTYWVVAQNQMGTTLPSLPVTFTGSGGISLSWDPVPGATSYNIFKSNGSTINQIATQWVFPVVAPNQNTGGIEYLYTPATTFVDIGYTGNTVALPIADTTAGLDVLNAGTSLYSGSNALWESPTQTRMCAANLIPTLTMYFVPQQNPILFTSLCTALGPTNIVTPFIQSITYTEASIVIKYFSWSTFITGKPWSVYSSSSECFVYLPVGYQDPINYTGYEYQASQQTYFIVEGNEQPGAIVAKFLYQSANLMPTYGQNGIDDSFFPIANYGPVTVAETPQTGPNSWITPCGVLDDLSSNGGTIQALAGVVSVEINLNAEGYNWARAEVGSNLHIGGGFLAMYDGQTVCEHGFHLFPPTPILKESNDDGSLSTGAYQYVTVYAWQDNLGQIHRSAPSLPLGVNLSSGENANILYIPYLQMTAKESVWIEVYRTQANGNIFSLTATTSVIENGTAVTNQLISNAPDNATQTTTNWVTYTDYLADATIAGTQTLYTTGNVLEAIPPDPCAASMCVYNQRLWVLDDTNPLVLWFSQFPTPALDGGGGAPLYFNNSLTFNVDPRGGNVTAIAPLGPNLIIFKESSIFWLSGQGPDATGAGSDYGFGTLITTDAGCVDPQSIETVPQGLIFKSAKGIYQLDQGLNVTYKGYLVEAYNDQLITSTQLMPSVNEVRFTLAPSPTLPVPTWLVWNYLVDQWSVFTGLNAIDSVIYQGTHIFLTPTGQLFQETPGVYSDSGNFIPILIKTPPMDLAGMMGYMALWEINVLGQNANSQLWRVSLAHDYSQSFSQVDIIRPQNTAWGSGTSWGSDPIWGGYWQPPQFMVFPNQTLTEAIQIQIESLPSGQGPWQGVSLSGLTLIWGSTGRTFPNNPSQQY